MEFNDPNWIELKNKIKGHPLQRIHTKNYEKNLKMVRAEMHKQFYRKINPASMGTKFLFELYAVDDGPMVMSKREFQIAAQTVAIELGLVIDYPYNPDFNTMNGYQIHLSLSI